MLCGRRAVLASAIVALAPLRVLAQPSRLNVARIGYLEASMPQDGTTAFLEDFRQGMRELGYIEGKNLRLEVRWGEGDLERLPALADELVRLNVDVIVAVNSPSVVAAGHATRTIPIVMPLSSDPVADGLVASLARPGGNVTGLSVMSSELGQKRLQLLKDLFSQISLPVAVLWNPDYVGMSARFRQAQNGASVAGMGVRSVQVRNANELERALASMDHERPDALLILADPLTTRERSRIVEFAAAERLPAMYENSRFVDAGGLISYGPNVDEIVRRSATYVDKILKGAKPGDLAIEQPTKFELVINLKSAKAQGITFPRSILLQADRLIE
jgi:putative tryptophan/tyrosine transport system substrate-binding protein